MSDKRGINRDYDYASSNDLLTKKPSRSFSMKSQKPPDMKLRSMLTKSVSHFDRANEDNIKIRYVKEILEVIESSWQLPVIGRDLAYEFSDTLRREKVLAYIVSKLQLEGGTAQVQRECARLLNQILTTDNRHYVAKNCLEVITKYTKVREDIDIVRINVGILESLFKDSETTCTRLIDFGALDTVLHACRHDDLWTARHCAAALANAAIFGGSINHKRMVDKGAPDWLFPLAFRTDDFCRFYTCLAVTVLAANPLVEKAVEKSGTLDLVEPFVQSHDPYEFAQSNPTHAQGRSASFLQRMIPLLISGRSEAQALASFYFAMEASIKAKQQKTQLFADISAIIPLKRVIATSRSSIARVLAGRCLKIIGEDVPRKLSPQIHLWDIEDVQSWLTVAGFRGFQASFRASTVDGEMLLLLTERELKEDLDMTNNVHRKRFIRDLNRLRAGADYRSVDTSNICDWLRQIDSNFVQYTYQLLQAGVDRAFLPLLADPHLKDDCGIENGVHRTRILSSVEKLGIDSALSSSRRDFSDCHDVFISYRRNNGSHLASLLKVHLQVRGFRVFLDVESLQEGDFADRTLKSVRSASAGFILVLTAGALDKCAIDHEGTDWLHKEIATAIGNRSNIVPVTTETFQWPLPEDLPKDISPICFFNGVKWIHEYQDACVDKIERFLRGQDPPAAKLSRMASSVKGSRDTVTAPPQKRPTTHPNHPVRPSGSSDNLVESGKFPRPRQRASPPGQASNLPVSVANRGVTGAQSESARSLDQGDGASTPYEQGSKQMQYRPSNKSNVPGKKQNSPSSLKPKTGSPSSPPSTTSTASSMKNLSSSSKGIKKDIVRLDEVMGGTSERSSESDSSSKFMSSEESEEEWENTRNKRGGADGKSKKETKPTQAKPPVIANGSRPVQNQPVKKVTGNGQKLEKIGAKKLPGMNSANQLSPEQKPKPSNKYKAPPPPPSGAPSRRTEATSPPGGSSDPIRAGQPEPHPRPTIPARPVSINQDVSSKPVPLSARSEPGGTKDLHGRPTPTRQENSPKPAVSESNVPTAASRESSSKSKDPTKVTSSSTEGEILPSGNQANNEKKKDDAQENGKKASSSMDKASFTESPIMDGELSESEYSDINSLEEEEYIAREKDHQRTNADGGTTTSSASRSTSSSTPSDLESKPTKIQTDSTERNGNNNNSNNKVHMNGNRTKEEPRYQRNLSPPNIYPRSNSRSPDREPRPNSQSQLSSSRSTPLSRSSHSIGSADHSALSSPRKQPVPGGLSNLVARRDVAPQEVAYAPRRSASERLQLSRPSHITYPTGGSHFHPTGSNPPPYHQPGPQKSPGYNMDHYKAAMAMSPPYSDRQMSHYPPGAVSHPTPKTRPLTAAQGFDTAV